MFTLTETLELAGDSSRRIFRCLFAGMHKKGGIVTRRDGESVTKKGSFATTKGGQGVKQESEKAYAVDATGCARHILPAERLSTQTPGPFALRRSRKQQHSLPWFAGGRGGRKGKELRLWLSDTRHSL